MPAPATAITAAAPAITPARKRSPRLPIAFSTLGCPQWDWPTILAQAAQLGYAALELRGLQGEMDLTKRPEFGATRLRQSLNDLAALDLRIIGLGSSARLHEFEPAKRAEQLGQARKFIDLAHRLHAPYVRVFGNNYVKDQPKAATIERIAAGLRELGEYARSSGVAVLLESHGDFNDSPALLDILRRAEMPAVGFLWDAHNMEIVSQEEPARAFQQLGRYIRHTHLKDTQPDGKERRCVLVGAGTAQARETVRVLATGGYRGYYCFEWEKHWHPEIEEPEVAFPHFARTIREYLAAAGVTESFLDKM